MRKVMTILCTCITLISFIMNGTMTAHAAVSIDSAKESSLKLQYQKGGETFAGLEIKTYRVAEVLPDGLFVLNGDFAKYPVKMNEVTSQAEWRTITTTLEAYAAADEIKPTYEGVTAKDGFVSFEGITPGMYLTLGVTVEEAEQIIVFESFLTAIPYPNEDGTYNYDVVANPKSEVDVPSVEEVEYKVVKQWKDSGFTEKRPATVQIDILKNGEIESTQILSSENNWSYIWKVVDDGSKWQVVERVIPENYTVTVVENGTTILITNSYEYAEEDGPKTGDLEVIWPYVLLMCTCGAIVIVIAIWRKRNE